MFKILCTGNPEHIGIAMEIKKLFPDATFISRTNGYDLKSTEGLDKLRSILKNYNVFINNAHPAYGIQLKILKIINEEWETGHVFNIGTVDEYLKWYPAFPDNFKEGNELKNLGLELTDENFKVTHITAGGFKSSSNKSGRISDLMDPKHIADSIKWIMEAKFQVPVIGIEKMTPDIRFFYNAKKQGIHL